MQSLAFSPDGRHLLAGGRRGAAFWSAMPIVWNDPDRAAEKLRLLLHSNADFPSRIRMLSENLRLHEALAKLDAKDQRVQAALAATQANWHASRKAWPEAVAAFDRLVAADPKEPEAWLRTPGLLRLATALLHQNRPCRRGHAVARRRQTPHRGWDPTGRLSEGRTIRQPENSCIPCGHSSMNGSPKRRETPGCSSCVPSLPANGPDAKAQVADYTAAIEALAQQKPEAAADLKRLYRRRGNAYVGLQKWAAGPRRLRPCRDRHDNRRGIANQSGDGTRGGHARIAARWSILKRRWTVLKPVEANQSWARPSPYFLTIPFSSAEQSLERSLPCRVGRSEPTSS